MTHLTRQRALGGRCLAALSPLAAACGGSTAPTAAPPTATANTAPAAATTARAAATTAPTTSSSASAAPTAATKPPATEPAKLTFLGNHALAPGKAVEAAVTTFTQKNPTV